MMKENGDDYIKRTASFVRTHERQLADSSIVSRRRDQRTPTSSASIFSWIGLGSTEKVKNPSLFTDDLHHLFYLLMRFEALGIDVGSLDMRVQNPSRPTSISYLAMLALKDRSDVLSISSFRSTISSVSKFSLGGGWFGRSEPVNLDAELKYLYSAFTKLPALCVRASGLKMISELAEDPPTDSAMPMDAFKNLQTLECNDIDPRMLMGWDRLSEGLRSLSVTRSGLEDVTDLLVDSVIDDKLRREGNPLRISRRRLVHRPSSFRSRPSLLHVAHLPAAVPEDSEQTDFMATQTLSPGRELPIHAWSLLAHLSLSDNNLTFLPPFPPLPSLVSLDLSSNLLISVPPCLSSLPSLKSLNLAHNMVDSLLGIYSQIPLIVSLNISSNRLDSLCGLERLKVLSRVDLRDNRLEDIDEIGRLAVLADVKEVWVSGNPCTHRDQDWRMRCFNLFAKESRDIILDGTPPGLLERRAMSYHVGKDGLTHLPGDNGRPISQPLSPRVDGASTPFPLSSPQTLGIQHSTPPSPSHVSSAPPAVQSIDSLHESKPARRRKHKRIVDLNGKESTDELSQETRGIRRSHGRHSSEVGISRRDAQVVEDTNNAQRNTKVAAAAHVPASIVVTRAEKSPEVVDPQPSAIEADISSLLPSSTVQPPAAFPRISRGTESARISSSTKANKRRARLSPSMYEPASPSQTFSEQDRELEQSSDSLIGGLGVSEADIFRKRIEALRNEVGDSWLKVLSQTHLSNLESGSSS